MWRKSSRLVGETVWPSSDVAGQRTDHRASHTITPRRLHHHTSPYSKQLLMLLVVSSVWCVECFNMAIIPEPGRHKDGSQTSRPSAPPRRHAASLQRSVSDRFDVAEQILYDIYPLTAAALCAASNERPRAQASRAERASLVPSLLGSQPTSP
jgi:hypothetical protein